MKIRVRDLSINDAHIVNKWHNDKSLFELLVGSFYGPTIEESIRWIKKYCDDKQTFRGIVSDRDGNDIGIVYLINGSSNNEAELGIFVADKNNRNLGYGKEMLCWVINFGFNVLKLDNIFLYVLESNVAAVSLYTKFNFLENTDLSKTIVKDGKQVNAKYMYLKKGAFNERNR